MERYGSPESHAGGRAPRRPRLLAPRRGARSSGAAIGLVPGATTLVSAFAAWSVEKRVSRDAPDHRRDIACVAAPEAANNASAQTGFVALFGLGIPSNVGSRPCSSAP